MYLAAHIFIYVSVCIFVLAKFYYFFYYAPVFAFFSSTNFFAMFRLIELRATNFFQCCSKTHLHAPMTGMKRFSFRKIFFLNINYSIVAQLY